MLADDSAVGAKSETVRRQTCDANRGQGREPGREREKGEREDTIVVSSLCFAGPVSRVLCPIA